MAHNITINEETLERFMTNSPTLIQVLTEPLATPAMIHIAFVKGGSGSLHTKGIDDCPRTHVCFWSALNNAKSWTIGRGL